MMNDLIAYLPWLDRKTRFSWLRLAVFMVVIFPALLTFGDLAFAPLRPEPYEEAIHSSGKWALYFLIFALSITPLRRIFRWNRLVGVRRMIGVSSMLYALLHLVFYAGQENWQLIRVTTEIITRFYLIIGLIALMGLVALGLTSFDTAIRKMGKNWNRLHRLIYLITPLGLWHHFLQSKSDVTAATLLTGCFALLMCYRMATRTGAPLQHWITLISCAFFAATLTALAEYLWYDLATGIPAHLVLQANFAIGNEIRPAVWTLSFGVTLAVISAVKMYWPLLHQKSAAQKI